MSEIKLIEKLKKEIKAAQLELQTYLPPDVRFYFLWKIFKNISELERLNAKHS